MNCPCCTKKITQKTLEKGYYVNGRQMFGIYECPNCGAVFGECYLGDSYSIVKPYFAPNANDIPIEQTRYYDLTTLGSQGIGRRHGWFDPQSRYIVQTG